MERCVVPQDLGQRLFVVKIDTGLQTGASVGWQHNPLGSQ